MIYVGGVIHYYDGLILDVAYYLLSFRNLTSSFFNMSRNPLGNSQHLTNCQKMLYCSLRKYTSTNTLQHSLRGTANQITYHIIKIDLIEKDKSQNNLIKQTTHPKLQNTFNIKML